MNEEIRKNRIKFTDLKKFYESLYEYSEWWGRDFSVFKRRPLYARSRLYNPTDCEHVRLEHQRFIESRVTDSLD